jgi:hypothetical protein
MARGQSKEEVATRNNQFSLLLSLLRKLIELVAVIGLLMGATPARAGEPLITEYQVKALFLLNFVKYVDWPSSAFAQAETPMIIGVFGTGEIEGDLSKSVKNKSINGREIVMRRIGKAEDFDRCHILFISHSEKRHLGEIFNKIKTLPVLTVGESEQFIEKGGIINFVKKEGKVRLEINADSALHSGLQISSKLLNVADVVKGKQ